MNLSLTKAASLEMQEQATKVATLTSSGSSVCFASQI
jgi:hypothetical protein